MTGGAGFIGSHYVRTLLSGGYPGYEDAAGHGLRQAHLRGQPREPRPGAGQPPVHVRPGRHLRPGEAGRGPARPRRGDQLRRRVARGPVDRRRGRVRQVQRARRPGAARRLPHRRHPPHRARLDRRGLRLDRRGRVDRAVTARPQLPLQRGQGRRRPASPSPSPAPTGSTSRSPGAATTTARTSTRRRSSRCSPRTCSTASRCRSTATA